MMLTSYDATFLFGEILFKIMGLRGKGQEICLPKIESVLVVRLDKIGDVVMTVPFLRELRRNLPDAWITLVIRPKLYNLLELCPYVNEVLVYDWNGQGILSQIRGHGQALMLGYKKLWRRCFDLAIVPRYDADYYNASLVAYLSGASWRVCYSEDVIHEKKRLNDGINRLFTHIINDKKLKHEVEHNLDVICSLGGQVCDDRLELWTVAEDEAFAEWLLQVHKIQQDVLLVALAPGAGEPKRMWPLERFIEIGQWLKQVYGGQILVIGGTGEEYLGDVLSEVLGVGAINATGRTTLRQTVALLRRCRLFIGNDAGPLHLAAAVGLPVVELSCHPRVGNPLSHNAPQRFGPWKITSSILQPENPRPPCTEECIIDDAHCILDVTVEMVKLMVAEHYLGHM